MSPNVHAPDLLILMAPGQPPVSSPAQPWPEVRTHLGDSPGPRHTWPGARSTLYTHICTPFVTGNLRQTPTQQSFSLLLPKKNPTISTEGFHDQTPHWAVITSWTLSIRALGKSVLSPLMQTSTVWS